MSAHTPGPWGIESETRGEQGSELIVTVGDGGYTVARCSVGLAHDECAANARLIAAAPDLLAALEELAAALFESRAIFGSDVSEETTRLYNARSAADAAIKKARGQ